MQSVLFLDFQNRMLEQRAEQERVNKLYERLPEKSKLDLNRIIKSNDTERIRWARRRLMSGCKDFSVATEAKEQETLKMIRNLGQETNPYKCPKWVKGTVNFFTKHHVK